MLTPAPDPAADAAVWPGWRGALGHLPYVALDLETTGLDPDADRVVELAACGPAGLEFTTLIDPGAEIEITGPHGLTAPDLAGAPRFEGVAWRLRRLLAGRIVVAHNARFDLAFVGAEFARLGRPLPPIPFLCTIGLAQALGLGHESRSLAYACHRHGVSLPAPHTAAADALAAGALFDRYATHADALGLDLGALAAADAAAAHAQAWRLPPLQPPHRREFRPSLAALPRHGLSANP